MAYWFEEAGACWRTDSLSEVDLDTVQHCTLLRWGDSTFFLVNKTTYTGTVPFKNILKATFLSVAV